MSRVALWSETSEIYRFSSSKYEFIVANSLSVLYEEFMLCLRRIISGDSY